MPVYLNSFIVLKKAGSCSQSRGALCHRCIIPSHSLYCEAGMTSLHLRRQLLLLRYVTKFLPIPSHIIYLLHGNHRLASIYDCRSTFTESTGIRALEIAPQHPTADHPSARSVRRASLTDSRTKLLAGSRQ